MYGNLKKLLQQADNNNNLEVIKYKLLIKANFWHDDLNLNLSRKI